MGSSELAPMPQHCQAVGDMLARMHLAGKDYNRHQPNLRGLTWWYETVPVVLPFLNASQSSLIQSELAFQNHTANSSAYVALPRGPVHADLFRDNVMFEGKGESLQLTVPPGKRLEALKGNWKGFHSIRINDQWRICFRWESDGPHEVEIVDYH
jgi:plasmid maintenance system killer protein